MVVDEKYHTEIGKLVQDGVISDRIVLDGKEYMQAVYNGKLVFNRALYHLEIPDFVISMPAAAFSLKAFLEGGSYKKDFGSTALVAVEFTVEPETIAPNETELTRAGDYTVTQERSGLTLKGSWAQEADKILAYSIKDAKISGVQYMQALASGDVFLDLVANYSGKKIPIWASGKEGKEEDWGGTTSNFLSLTGRSLVSGATFDFNTGEVYAPYLGTTPTSFRAIAEVTYVKIQTEAGELEWSGTAYAYQEANEKYTYSSVYDVSSDVPQSGGTINSEASILTIYISSWYREYQKWTSGADGGSTSSEHTVFITATEGTLSKTSASGSDTVTLSVGQNNTGSSRKISIRVYSTTAGYDKTFTVTQEAFVDVEYWASPELDGSLTSIVIPASGSGVAVRVPIIQNYYKNGQIIETYKATVNATAVTGSSVNGTGTSFSGGLISASSMGTTSYPSGRAVYYLATVTVTGKDGKSYKLTLPSTVEVRQAENIKTTTYGDYVLSVSANPSSGIANTGGTSTITASAQITEKYSWSSGADGGSKLVGSNAFLKTTHGSISPTEITGTNQKATLTLGENLNEFENTATITLYVGNASKTCTVKQNAVSFEFYSNTMAGIGASGGDMVLQLISTRNGKAFPVSLSNVAVSGLSGATVKSVTAISSGDVGAYSVVVSVPANTSTNSRNFTITATQPTSGKTCVWDATQTGVTVAKKKAFFGGSFIFGSDLATGAVNYNLVSVSNSVMSAVGDNYTGGTLSSLRIQLVGANGSVIDYKDFGDVTVQDESTTAITLRSFSNTGGSANVSVQVRYDGAVQQTLGIMMPVLPQSEE